jgi:hypothetical protein
MADSKRKNRVHASFTASQYDFLEKTAKTYGLPTQGFLRILVTRAMLSTRKFQYRKSQRTRQSCR